MSIAVHGSGSSGSSGQTDAEERAYQTATGTITASGQSVTLSLNGASGASVNFIDSSFNGTVRFYSSCDGGTTYIETQAFNVYGNTGGATISNSWQGIGITPTRIWNFVLVGGETHVRVTSVSGSSGSVAVTIKANDAAPNPIGLAVCPTETGDYGRPVGGVYMMVRNGASGVRSPLMTANRYESNQAALIVLSRTSTSNVESLTTVSDTATDTQLIGQTVGRIQLFITNTSSAVLYVRLGSGTASATAFTKRLAQWETWEVPTHWIGTVRGVWATDPGDGAAILHEITEP